MDRHRDVRRGMAATNGLARRRQRNNSLRDSPEEDGAVELHESTRLRDRVSKKDRDRVVSRHKRRRGDRLMHGSNRDGGDEDSSEDSLDDEDEDDDDEPGPTVRMRPPNPASSSLSNHHHRKSFPPAAKVARPTTTWKVSDEMGFSVPKKARSASTKRSHECWVSGGGGGVGGGGGGSGSGEQIHRQASTSPARPNVVPSMAPGSPSSSTASVRKKMKPIGAKHRPPKISNKPSSIQDDIEIEVAEVLYGLMRQSQGPTRQELGTNSSQKLDSRDTNGSGNDAKSRVSSPISASPSSAAPQMSKLPQNSSSSTNPMSAVAPKRKRPRPVKFEEENSAIFNSKNGPSTSKVETEQSAKIEPSSTKLERNSGSAESYNGVSFDFGSSQATTVPLEVHPDSAKPDINTITDAKPLTEESVVRDGDQTKKVVTSPQKESSSCAKVEFDPENATATKATPTAAVVENHREESFKIDLMAPPLKSSPERDSDMGFVSDLKPMVTDIDMKMENQLKEKANVDTNYKKDFEAVLLDKKTEAMVDESESQKSIAHKQTLDLQIDLEKHNKDCGPSSVRQQIQQQHQSKTIKNEPKMEKAVQSTNSLPLPMAIAGWPGGLPPMGRNGMGQIRPLQGMASLDGTPLSSNSVQPRAKRCATHYNIARNIYYHQQFTKMNPYWPAAAGSASLYGNKPYNLNVMPPSEAAIIGSPLLGSFPGRNLNPIQEKAQVEGAKDKSSVAANFLDSQQGKLVSKQLVLQQPPQQAALHGPAFIFPLNQQQAAVPAGSKVGATKSSNAGNAVSSIGSQPAAGAPGNSSSTAAATASTMSFNYPNMQPSEAQYVAILQNNGYPFPVPAHVGAPASYRGTPPQALPFFNGQFYSSQMMHPQLQQQQQLQQLQQSQTQQQSVQQGHQNTSTSSGSSSSQKHQHTQQQNHQQRLQSGSNAASGNSNNFHSKNRPQKPQNQSYPAAHQARQPEADMTAEDGPSNEDSRVSQAHKNAYGHNFNMPMHPKNFPSMSSAVMVGGASGNHSEKQQQQQHQQQHQQHQQQQSMKAGPELIPAQAYAMPFASFNGGTAVSGLDFSSMAQNHVIFQSLPEAAARHNFQIAAAAAAAQAQQKKMHQVQEEGKAASDSHNVDDERKAVTGKGPPNVAQAIVFSRPDSTDPSASILGNSVVESSARTLNLISSPSNGNRNSRSTISTTSAVSSATNNVNTSNSQQHHQQQMNQLMQLQKQQQQQMQVMHQQQQQLHQQLAAAAAARGKPSTTSTSSAYSDRLSSSSSMAAKFPNNAHYFPEVLIQGGNSTQSPQWKNTRAAASPVSSPSLASSTTSLKNLPQQQGRTQQGHTQISFGVNSKPGNAQHGQQIPTGNQSPSPPVAVGSPPTSVSKSAGGSPRASSTGSKVGSTPSLSSQQQAKNSSSGPSRKSSPVGGRNVPSNLGNSHVSPAPCSTTKSNQALHHQTHMQQQQQQQTHMQQQQSHIQQQHKQAMQQQQLFFSSTYMQAQSPQSTSSASNTTGTPNISYYQQRRQQPGEQQQGSSHTASSGMLSLSPSLTLAGSSTSDPTKAVAAATANMKGGLPPPGLLQAAQFATQSGGHQFMSSSFPYLHAVPGVQVKPADQKQPAA
ncbi:hypothetical protein ACHQM5_027155 [Ranunculus cassubicifolius]